MSIDDVFVTGRVSFSARTMRTPCAPVCCITPHSPHTGQWSLSSYAADPETGMSSTPPETAPPNDGKPFVRAGGTISSSTAQRQEGANAARGRQKPTQDEAAGRAAVRQSIVRSLPIGVFLSDMEGKPWRGKRHDDTGKPEAKIRRPTQPCYEDHAYMRCERERSRPPCVFTP